MKSIYIVLTKTNTALSRVIGVVTSDPYTHASISMDKKLDSLYTFSRLQPEKPLPAGFTIESPYTGYMGLHPDTACEVYEMKISNVSYHKIKKQILHMSQQSAIYRYSILGTIYCMFRIKHKRPKHYFCSQFVSEVLEKSGAMELPKHSTLMHPNDYTRLEELRCVYKGTLAGLPQRQQMEFDQNDTVIGVYLGLALGLFHTGAARVREIF